MRAALSSCIRKRENEAAPPASERNATSFLTTPEQIIKLTELTAESEQANIAEVVTRGALGQAPRTIKKGRFRGLFA